MESKKIIEFENENLLMDLEFLFDITHLNELNVRKDKFISNMFQTITAFESLVVIWGGLTGF